MKWFQRLKQGLSRSTDKVKEQLSDVFGKSRLDPEDIESLEEALILADMGPKPAAEIAKAMGKRRYEKGITSENLMGALAEEVAEILKPVSRPLDFSKSGVQTILMIGVNGSGKTTSIAKLARQFKAEGKKVMLVAGDTFRAAAVEQLEIWGARADVPVLSARQGGDAAGLVFDAMTKAEEQNIDILLIDTAGRLHNKHNLMQELGKIVRVMGKKNSAAPHNILLVLDGGAGQNALEQVRVFSEVAPVSGLLVTKLDGTAKAGVVVALAQKYALPIHYIGVGEGAEDLQIFDADGFARALIGHEYSAS